MHFLCGVGYWFSWLIDLAGRDPTKRRRTFHLFFFFFKPPCHGEIRALNQRARKTEGLASQVLVEPKSGPALVGRNTHCLPQGKRNWNNVLLSGGSPGCGGHVEGLSCDSHDSHIQKGASVLITPVNVNVAASQCV